MISADWLDADYCGPPNDTSADRSAFLAPSDWSLDEPEEG